MDTFKQVRDVFAFSHRAHQQISEYYARLADQAERRRVEMLLDYLSRHEANQQACLQRYAADVSNALLNAWLQYVPETFPFADLPDTIAAPDMSVADVVEMALRLDDALIEFYGELAENADALEVRELFENLRQIEVSAEVSLKREAAEF
jgi:rubrerythrin